MRSARVAISSKLISTQRFAYLQRENRHHVLTFCAKLPIKPTKKDHHFGGLLLFFIYSFPINAFSFSKTSGAFTKSKHS